MEFIQAIGLLIFAWFATISGVITGGYLVFKTKRDGRLFPSLINNGKAFNLDDGVMDPEKSLSGMFAGMGKAPTPPEEEEIDLAAQIFERRQAEFEQQLTERTKKAEATV